MFMYMRNCPICGKENRGLLLEETKGWMECEVCGAMTHFYNYDRAWMLPLFRTKPV